MDEIIFAEHPEEGASARCLLEAALLCIRHGRQDRKSYNVGQHPKASQIFCAEVTCRRCLFATAAINIYEDVVPDGQGTERALNVPDGQSLTMLQIACSHALLF